MTACFADTFYFVALFNPRDESHVRAATLSQSLRRPIVTTTWILAELGDSLAGTNSRRLFAKFGQRFRLDPRSTIVPASEETFQLAIQLYDQRSDKAWSLTDCISFIVMRDHHLSEALTGDHHFEQAGFVALLK